MKITSNIQQKVLCIIIGILIGYFIPIMIENYLSFNYLATEQVANNTLREISDLQENYYRNNGYYANEFDQLS